MTPAPKYEQKIKVLENGDIYLIWQENNNPKKIKIPIEKFERIEAAAFEMYDLLSEIRRTYDSKPYCIMQFIPRIDALLRAIGPQMQEADNDA